MVSCLPGNDGESKGAHDDPLAIDHLQQRLQEEEQGDDGVEEVDEEEMGENEKKKKKRTLMRNQT